ncbi:MAG: hypothetical protein AB7P02_30295, partial [Alphaproteobacteria bacterium]
LALARVARAPTNFGLAEECRRGDLQFVGPADAATAGAAMCIWVAHVVHGVGVDADPGWAAAADALARAKVAAPATWLVVGMRIADAGDLLDVRYYFNPAAAGFPDDPPRRSSRPPAAPGLLDLMAGVAGDLVGHRPVPRDPRWRDSAWSPAAVAHDPRRSELVRGLVAWAAGVRPVVYSGFSGWPVSGVAAPAAWSGLPAPAAGDGGRTGGSASTRAVPWWDLRDGVDAAASYGADAVARMYRTAQGMLGVDRGPRGLVTRLAPAGIDR